MGQKELTKQVQDLIVEKKSLRRVTEKNCTLKHCKDNHELQIPNALAYLRSSDSPAIGSQVEQTL